MSSQQSSSSRQKQLEQLFELSMDLLCIAGFDGHFKVVNPAFQTLLGYSEAEMLSRPFVDFIHPEDREEVAKPMERLADGLTVVDFENRYQCRDGSYRWLAWRARANSGGEIFAVARDITERKRSEAEQESLRIQMQNAQKLESLGVLAGGIAHDFNNLLVGILGNSNLARSEVAAESKAFGFLANIEIAATRAAELANQMLAYAGQSQMQKVSVNVGAMIVELTELLRVSIRKNTKIQFDFANRLPSVNGDPTQLRQVIMNLITNAADAIGNEPGEIFLEVGTLHFAEGRVGLFLGQKHPPGDYLFFKVRDTGCGMHPATIDHIFDPFYSTKLTGRGLGLSAVLGIVRGHGGVIEVESSLGKGTTFSIILPTGEPTQEPTCLSASSANLSSDWRGSGKVLVVDDEVMVRHVAELSLMELGFEVLTAPNGRVALELYEIYEDEIVLVFLDLIMPVLDGEATLKALREKSPNIKVVLSTGFTASVKTEWAADAFLPKPFCREDIVRTLRTVWDKPSSA